MPPEYIVADEPVVDAPVETIALPAETDSADDDGFLDEDGDTPDSPAETPAVDAPSEILYDLPDGRKVTGEVVREEYGNLMRDYTQKSQRLAAYEKVANPEIKNVPDWQKPDYVPTSYAEIIQIAKQQAKDEIRQEREQEETQKTELSSQIEAELAEIKKVDPNLNENSLFLHANKYGFRDLSKAYENMKALNDAKLSTEQRTVKNIQARKDNPVAGKPGTASPTAPVYGDHNQYGSALEYLQAHQ